MKPINDLLATHGVPVYDPDDATLSSGEHAQAIIVAALNEQWDRLDGGQQRSIVNALDGSSPQKWCICPFDKTSSVTTSRTITS